MKFTSLKIPKKTYFQHKQYQRNNFNFKSKKAPSNSSWYKIGEPEQIEYDLTRTSWTHPGISTTMSSDKQLLSRCLADFLSRSYNKIRQEILSDENRVGYAYFGVQESGAMIQWPATQWCPRDQNGKDYDPRFRP